jgi:hypothetical protein
MSTMELVAANLAGKIQSKTWDGRDWYVVPMSIIVPGVLNGSKGPLLYPEDEVQKHPGLWNGIPITNGHPKRNGQYVSARDPDVLEEYGVGLAFNDRYENGKRLVDAWIDKAKLKSAAARIGDALASGQTMEQSTGLFTEDQVANEGANWKGTPYAHIARNYRPDHIAILPDGIGACSRKDGCGLNVNEQLSWWEQLRDFLVNALPNQPRSGNTGQYKPPGAGSGRGDTHSAAQTGFAQITDEDRTLAASVAGGTVNVDAEAWAAAMAEAKDDTNLAAHIYTRKGGTASEVVNVADKAKVDYIVANCSCYEEKDRETLNKFSDSTLDSIITDLKARVTVNATVDECKKMLKDMESKQNSIAESAAKAAVAAVNEALNAPRKTSAIAKLTANAKDDAKPALIEKLKVLDVDTLEVMAANVTPAVQAGASRPAWFGAAGGGELAGNDGFDKDDVLESTPTFSLEEYKEMAIKPRKVA